MRAKGNKFRIPKSDRRSIVPNQGLGEPPSTAVRVDYFDLPVLFAGNEAKRERQDLANDRPPWSQLLTRLARLASRPEARGVEDAKADDTPATLHARECFRRRVVSPASDRQG